MRVIVRCERPRPGAPLRSEDVDGYRLTAFAANTTRGQLADLEVRHRRRARGEGRILRLTDRSRWAPIVQARSEEHTSELQSRGHLVYRLLLEKKKQRYM